MSELPTNFFVLGLTLAQDVADINPLVSRISEAVAAELGVPRSYVSLFSILSSSTQVNLKVLYPNPAAFGSDVQAVATDLSTSDVQDMLAAAGLDALTATADASVTVLSPPPSPSPSGSSSSDGSGGGDGDDDDDDSDNRPVRRARRSPANAARGARCATRRSAPWAACRAPRRAPPRAAARRARTP